VQCGGSENSRRVSGLLGKCLLNCHAPFETWNLQSFWNKQCRTTVLLGL
jgi:hypothetical protein